MTASVSGTVLLTRLNFMMLIRDNTELQLLHERRNRTALLLKFITAALYCNTTFFPFVGVLWRHASLMPCASSSAQRSLLLRNSNDSSSQRFYTVRTYHHSAATVADR